MMFFHNQNPHRQDVSAVDERRKEETGFRLYGEKTQLFLWIQSLHDKPFQVFHGYCLFSSPSCGGFKETVDSNSR